MAHAQPACQQRFPEHELPVEIEGIVVEGRRRPCPAPAVTPEQKNIEAAYVFSHLVSNWIHHRDEIKRRLERRLRPLTGVSGVDAIVPQSCKSLSQSNLRQAPAQCSQSVARILDAASKSDSVSPGVATYFTFLKQWLAGESDNAVSSIINQTDFHISQDGSVQRSSCQSQAMTDQAGGQMLRTLNGIVGALGEVSGPPGSASRDPRSIISEYFAGSSDSARVTANVFTASPASRRSVGEHYFMRHNASLQEIATAGCPVDAADYIFDRVK